MHKRVLQYSLHQFWICASNWIFLLAILSCNWLTSTPFQGKAIWVQNYEPLLPWFWGAYKRPMLSKSCLYCRSCCLSSAWFLKPDVRNLASKLSICLIFADLDCAVILAWWQACRVHQQSLACWSWWTHWRSPAAAWRDLSPGKMQRRQSTRPPVTSASFQKENYWSSLWACPDMLMMSQSHEMVREFCLLDTKRVDYSGWCCIRGAERRAVQLWIRQSISMPLSLWRICISL